MAFAVDDKAQRRVLMTYLNATVTMVRSDSPDLTDRQKVVFLKSHTDDTPQTVRGLAAYCAISKPAITRALDRLASFDLIRRKTDPADRRSVLVQRTPTGGTYLRALGEILAESAQSRSLDERTKRRLVTAYMNATVEMVRSDAPDLTDRQKAVLLKVHVDDAPQTVRGLAHYCAVSKPAITRALDRLAEFDLVRRKTDAADRRSIFVQRTAVGSAYLQRIAEALLDTNQPVRA